MMAPSLLSFHLVFAVISAVALGATLNTELAGLAILVLLLGWNAAFASFYQDTELYRMWRWSALISVFQVIPDWFLASVLKTIKFTHFPYVPRVGGEVPIYMAFMWTMPLVWLLSAFRQPPGRLRSLMSPLPAASLGELVMAGTIALITFGAAELIMGGSGADFPLTLWTAAVKRRVCGHVAAYVLPAEAALGAAALVDYRSTAEHGKVQLALMAAAVSTFYAGALSISFLLIEFEEPTP